MIRYLNENDVDLFIKIREDSLRLDPKSFGAMPNVEIDREKTIQDLREKNDENFILGFFDQGELVGMLGFIRFQNMKTRHKGFIWGVFVYREYRGRQIGEQLLKECIARVSKLDGMHKILLSASHISAAALNLYQKLGFEIYGTEPNAMWWEGESIDEIFFQKVIS